MAEKIPIQLMCVLALLIALSACARDTGDALQEYSKPGFYEYTPNESAGVAAEEPRVEGFIPKLTGDCINITLIPDCEYNLNGNEVVSLAVPFAQGVLASDVSLAIASATGEEIPATVRGIVPWRNITGTTGYWQSVYIQFDYNYSNESVVRLYYGVNVTRSLDRIEAPYAESVFNTANGTFLRIWPTLPADWMADTGAFGHLIKSNQNTGYFSDIETKINEGFEAYKNANLSDYEPWGYDRVSTLYTLYARSGDPKFLREAYRSARLYNSLIYNQSAGDELWGAFMLKAEPGWVDLKYVFPQADAYHYILTGDPESLSTLDDMMHQMQRPFHDRYLMNYTPESSSFWTERHMGFFFIGHLYGYIITGNETTRQRLLNMADYLVVWQQHPPDRLAADGSWRHSQVDHGEGGDDSILISSPWMSSLIVSGALNKYHDLAGSREAAAAIANFGSYLAEYGIYREDSLAVSPWYLSSSLNESWNYRIGDEAAHNLEIASMLAIAMAYNTSANYSQDIERLYSVWLDDPYLTNPMRRYAWTFRDSLEILYYLPNFTGQQAVPVQNNCSFSINDSSGLGSPEWGFGPELGDMDNDGDIDIILTGHYGVALIYENLGDLRFQLREDLSNYVNQNLPPILNEAILVDFDNNSYLDLIFASDSWDGTTYFANYGNWNYTQRAMRFADHEMVSSMVFGDVDRDGVLEATSEYTGHSGGAYLWQWNSSESAFMKDSGFSLISQGVKPSLGDFDNDGDLDLCVGYFRDYGADKRIFLFRNNGTGRFTDATGETGLLPYAYESYDCTMADLDSDGDLDVITSDKSAMVLENTGGFFIDRSNSSGLPAHQALNSIAATADLNNDRLPDIVLSGYNRNLMIYLNDGSFHFTRLAGYDDTSKIAGAADLDGDNDTDLVVQSTLNQESPPATYLLVNSFRVPIWIASSIQMLAR